MVVFAELSWVPTALEQAEDRAHRVGQDKALQVHYMISKDSNSSDELMLKALRKKLHVVGRAVDGSLEGSAGLDMSAYIPVDDTEAGPSTPEEEVSTQPRVLGSQESSPRAVIASQERQAPSAPTKKRARQSASIVLSDSDSEEEGKAGKAGGPDYDDFTLDRMVNDKQFMAQKKEKQEREAAKNGGGEAEEDDVIDLTQEFVEESQPRRTSQFSLEEQGPLASDPED